MESENPLKKLRVVAYNTQRIGRQIPENSGNWFLAEACARHTFVSLDPQDELPAGFVKKAEWTKKVETHFAERKDAPRVETGADAYAFLLMVATGLLSKHRGEPHAKGKISDNWTAYTRRPEGMPKGFTQMMENIFADSKLVRDSVFSKLHSFSKEPALAARQMAGMQQTDKKDILIVAENEQMTENTFKIVGQQGKRIVIAHSDPAELERQYDTVLRAKKAKKIEATVEKILTRDITPGFLDGIDHTFVCTPMGTEPAFEQVIIDHWKDRPGKGSLIHLRGVPTQRGQTAGAWLEVKDTPGFIDREMIAHKQKADARENQHVFQEAMDACRNCAYTRAMGDGKKRPLKQFISLSPKDYAARTSSALRPEI